MTTAADMMVVTPHPDDAEFGVAGTVGLWTKEGRQVVYVVCTNGDKGTSDRSMKPERLAEIREQEQKSAAEVLGVDRLLFGCDMSMTPGVGKIRGAHLGAEDKQKILGGNMAQLLKMRG